jgi:hypothetical protein
MAIATFAKGVHGGFDPAYLALNHDYGAVFSDSRNGIIYI